MYLFYAIHNRYGISNGDCFPVSRRADRHDNGWAVYYCTRVIVLGSGILERITLILARWLEDQRDKTSRTLDKFFSGTFWNCSWSPKQQLLCGPVSTYQMFI
jgi:hypothetical protein